MEAVGSLTSSSTLALPTPSDNISNPDGAPSPPTNSRLNRQSNNTHSRPPKKVPVCNANISQFAIETYFIWFSALIFITELIVDVWLAVLYFGRDKAWWGLTTAGIIVLPLGLCQLYSLWLLRTDNYPLRAGALLMHICLLGIPYRYHSILRTVEQDKSLNQNGVQIKHSISDANAIQTMNATFQYCPQFLFQSFLIVYQKYKCILTGVSAGLAGFSFLWHVFIHFYYLIKRFHKVDPFERFPNEHHQLQHNPTSSTMGNHHSSTNTPHIIDNLSTSFNEQHHHQHRSLAAPSSAGPSSLISNNLSQASVSLTDSLRNFEKPTYKTDDKNLMPKKSAIGKNVEKSNIFGFNKRRPIYQHEEYDMMNESAAAANLSTVFFEIDDSRNGNASGGKFNRSTSNKDMDNFLNENSSNATMLSKAMNDFQYNFGACDDTDDDVDEVKREKLMASGGAIKKNSLTASTMMLVGDNRNSLLKRKGICSSQEMLHLVDIMNDHISPEQVDVLAKSMVEMGDVSISTDEPLSEERFQDISSNLLMPLDHSKLLDHFPDMIDDHRLLENIDAAIYENQIIFQERIRKNQLTIQNLKLQDQMLSKCIEDMKSSTHIQGTEILSIRDYENMCFTNISRQNRGMKHWRNYLNDIDTSNHDSSTVQHSSFYVNTNTLSTSATDLYINEVDDGGASTVIIHDDEDEEDDDKGTSNGSVGSSGLSGIVTKKGVRWSNKLSVPPSASRRRIHEQQRHRDRLMQQFCAADDETVVSDDLYIDMNGGGASSMDSHERNHPTEEDDNDDDEVELQGAAALPEKNILVETINKINVDSPVKSLLANALHSKPIV